MDYPVVDWLRLQKFHDLSQVRCPEMIHLAGSDVIDGAILSESVSTGKVMRPFAHDDCLCALLCHTSPVIAHPVDVCSCWQLEWDWRLRRVLQVTAEASEAIRQ